MKSVLGIVAVCLLTCSVAFAGAPTISGNYLEVRSCDVFTAACFANSEVGLTGEEAIMAWDIRQGSFRGVNLAGLKVIAVVRASDTLGDSIIAALPAKSVIIVDEKATPIQREALQEFAKEMGAGLVDDVVRVETEAISMATGDCTKDDICGRLSAGDLVAIEARAINDGDFYCHNDEAFYPPLTDIDNAMPHVAELERFTGEGLGVVWNESGRRNTYIGTFSR